MSPTAFNTELGNCDQIVWNYTLFLPKNRILTHIQKIFRRNRKIKLPIFTRCQLTKRLYNQFITGLF